MQKSPWQKLLRIFFQFSSPVLIYIEQGKIRGAIFKNKVEQSTSDLTVFKAQDADIPIEPLNELEEVLALHQRYAYLEDGKHVLPVVNKNKEFVGLWQRSDLIKGFENLPEVRSWQPPKVSITQLENEQANEISKDTLDRLKEGYEKPKKTEKPTISIKTFAEHKKQKVTITNLNEPGDDSVADKAETSPPKAESKNLGDVTSPVTNLHEKIKIPQKIQDKALPELPEKVRKHLEHGYLAILTLQTLSLPLLAVDTKGEELFVNEDFIQEQQKYRHILDGGYLVKHSKDLMANLAMKGQLKADDTLELDLLGKERQIFMRPIRREPVGSYVQFDEQKSKTMGYLFWIENVAQQDQKSGKEKTSNAFIVKDLNSKSTQGFLGKTLPDIVSEEEKKAMLWALEESGGNLSNAAMLLGVPRQTFSYKYQKYFKRKN